MNKSLLIVLVFSITATSACIGRSDSLVSKNNQHWTFTGGIFLGSNYFGSPFYDLRYGNYFSLNQGVELDLSAGLGGAVHDQSISDLETGYAIVMLMFTIKGDDNGRFSFGISIVQSFGRSSILDNLEESFQPTIAMLFPVGRAFSLGLNGRVPLATFLNTNHQFSAPSLAIGLHFFY